VSGTLFTIGHSHHTVERFLALLRQHAIEVVADVRSAPYSQFVPQFNREALEHSLRAAEIRYVFMGEEFGARRKEPECYDDSRQVDFAKVVQTPAFQRGVERITRGVAQYRIALMCAEREPLDCHRTILVARHLSQIGFAIEHIKDDGSLESQAEAERRLIKEHKADQRDLFSEKSPRDLAYEKQAEKIAYREKAQTDQESP
jgi:uncharacterized protein (DUF488 family)